MKHCGRLVLLLSSLRSWDGANDRCGCCEEWFTAGIVDAESLKLQWLWLGLFSGGGKWVEYRSSVLWRGFIE